MKRAWRLLKYYARKMWTATGTRADRRIREAEREIYLPNGSSIWLRTAENEDSLTGEAVRGMVVDEFSLMNERIWTEFLEAALLDYGGWALFIGVPKGENWSAALWRNAASREGWQQFHYTTYDNSHMNRARIDEIRANVPERTWQQEYMAQILSDGGAVFRFVRQAAIAIPAEQAVSGHEYVIGVDLAKLQDWTVFAVIDLHTKELVYLDRFQQINYILQLGRLEALHERFQPTSIIVERNIGEMFIEAAQAKNLPVQAFMTTAATKQTLIETLALAFEREDIHILNDPVLIGELEAFSMERLPSGTLRYAAPSGMHDDYVIALALAWHGVTNAFFMEPLIIDW